MANKYDIEIRIDTIIAGHLLGGLAQSYRLMPGSAPSSVAFNIKMTMIEILEQLEKQGVSILQPRSAFRSYAKLVNYETYKALTKID
jgi:hypothetical protein